MKDLIAVRDRVRRETSPTGRSPAVANPSEEPCSTS